VGGIFTTPAEKAEYERLRANPAVAQSVQYFGFVSGAQKRRVLCDADAFCFPTFLPERETSRVNLIEAMAFGLPIVTTRWRSLAELFPAGYSGLVDIRCPDQIAGAAAALSGPRERGFLPADFSEEFHAGTVLAGLTDAFRGIEESGASMVSGPQARRCNRSFKPVPVNFSIVTPSFATRGGCNCASPR